jgi:putative oxidoreductase
MSIEGSVGGGALNNQGETLKLGRLIFPELRKFYDLADPFSYAVLRVAFGLILFTHGLPKALGGAHGAMANPFADSVNFITNTLNFPAPLLFGYFVELLETAGALMLALGLFTRLVAPMIAIEMAMICIILSPNWVWLDRGMEYALLMGFVALHISFRGGGQFSIDRLIGKEL